MFTSLAIFWVLKRSSAFVRKTLLGLSPVKLTPERLLSWSRTHDC